MLESINKYILLGVMYLGIMEMNFWVIAHVIWTLTTSLELVTLISISDK